MSFSVTLEDGWGNILVCKLARAFGVEVVVLGISKRGDKNLRRLLVQGARAIMQRIDRRTDRLSIWVRDLLARRHSNVVACALANKLARIAWAILAKGTNYRSEQAVSAT